MSAPIDSKQQKELKNWLKLREKRTAAVAARPMKHGKKSSTRTPVRSPSLEAVLSLALVDDHGWLISQGRSSGECNHIFLDRYQSRPDAGVHRTNTQLACGLRKILIDRPGGLNLVTIYFLVNSARDRLQ